MKLRSLGFVTELFYQRHWGEICDRGNYLVVKTPTLPDFTFGNYLLFREASKKQDLERWQELYRKEFSSGVGEVPFMTFGWDSPDGELGEAHSFFEQGFKLDSCVVMVGRKIHPPKQVTQDFEVKACQTDEDWEKIVQFMINARPDALDDERRKEFLRGRMEGYRRLSDNQRGVWFGGYLGGKLVASMGVYRSSGYGRFQEVVVHPDFRRLGIGRSFCWLVGERALSLLSIDELVTVADENGPAVGLYKDVGFEPREKQLTLFRKLASS